MMIYTQLFNTIIPVVICVGIGYVWACLERPFYVDFTSDLVMNVCTPCLVISSLVGVELDIGTIFEISYACLLIMVLVGIVSAVVLRATSHDLKTFLPSLMFGNIGNMGLPICLFAFGKSGLAVAYFATTALAMFTLGLAISQGKGGNGYLTVLRQPIVISVVAALAIKALGIDLPLVLQRPIQLVGDISIPMMLITLGVSLKQLQWVDMPKSIMMGTIRIMLGCLAAIIIVRLLGITGQARGVIIIQSAMPVAVFNYLFAVRYNRSPAQVAGVVVFSTLISFALLPVILSFLI